MSKHSNGRSRSRSAEKQRGCSYITPCNTKNDPVALLHHLNNERDHSLTQGEESSRRYAAFLKQDGLLMNSNFDTISDEVDFIPDRGGSQTSFSIDSPLDEIAPERFQPQKRRPSSTPAPYPLSSSKSHPGPGIACNFEGRNKSDKRAQSEQSSTTIGEDEVTSFQDGLTDVTHQLELIQETQGSILTELANDIEALQAENTGLRQSKERLQRQNDNLLQVVQDLSKEVARLKTPAVSIPPSNTTKLRSSEEIAQHVEVARSLSRTPSMLITRSSEQMLKTKESRSRVATVSSKKKTSSSKRHSKEGTPHSRSKSSKYKEHKSNNSSRVSAPPKTTKPTKTHSGSISVSRGHDERPRETSRSQRHSYSTNQDDSFSDDSQTENKKTKRKKRKSGCFSFGRKRRDHDSRRY